MKAHGRGVEILEQDDALQPGSNGRQRHALVGYLIAARNLDPLFANFSA